MKFGSVDMTLLEQPNHFCSAVRICGLANDVGFTVEYNHVLMIQAKTGRYTVGPNVKINMQNGCSKYLTLQGVAQVFTHCLAPAPTIRRSEAPCSELET